MGLDVYLYKYDDFAAYKQRQTEVREKEQLILEEVARDRGVSVDELSDKDRDNAYHLFKYWCKGQTDLDEYGDVEAGADCIEENHPKYPDHLFKIGYLRSSYNAGGINNILRNSIGKDLYYIFDKDDDEYEFFPDWEASLERAEEVYEELKEYMKQTGSFYVQEFSFNSFVPMEELIGSEKEALEKFMEMYNAKMAGPQPTDDWGTSPFSNREGTYAIYKPYNVVGVFPGTRQGFLGTLTGRGDNTEPCVYLIMQREDGESGVHHSYIESLEITIDMIKHVLAQDDPEKYVLHWSG